MRYRRAMHLRHYLLFVLVACLSVSCAGSTDAPENVEVVDARLENVKMREAGVAMGYVWGKADLLVVGADGGQYSWPVRFDGMLLGIVGAAGTTGSNLQTNFKLPDGSADPLDELPDPNRDEDVEPVDVVMADHLLGTYSGTGIGLAVFQGGHARHLKNDAGVVINPSYWMRGIGILWVFDSLTISLAE